MSLDATSLKTFYRSPLGQVVRRQLSGLVRSRWGNVSGMTVVGTGFASPYLGTFQNEADCIGCLMPARQGALIWPAHGSCHSVLVDEHAWPLPDSSVDRLLAVHCLEQSERLGSLLREMWRVLAADGRLIIVVPNRSGLWCRFDATPFGHGLPFSLGQLEAELNNALLTPVQRQGGLFFPPFANRVVLRSAAAVDRLGQRLPLRLAGAIVVEARKDMMAPIGRAASVREVNAMSPAIVGSTRR